MLLRDTMISMIRFHNGQDIKGGWFCDECMDADEIVEEGEQALCRSCWTTSLD